MSTALSTHHRFFDPTAGAAAVVTLAGSAGVVAGGMSPVGDAAASDREVPVRLREK